MIDITQFIPGFYEKIESRDYFQPWEITNNLKVILERLIGKLGDEYEIEDGIAIHKTAVVEKGVTMKSPVLIRENCVVGANAYFREGVFLDSSVKIGAGCEIKSSLICSNTAIAHLNYIGNSVIGQNVNFEAGSIAANHYNEREDKEISVNFRGEVINTNSTKFGSLVGDNSKIGANAVLSPGTILEKGSVVKRLELVEQIPDIQ